MYNKVTPTIINALRQIVGEGSVLTSADDMEPSACTAGGAVRVVGVG